MLGFDSKVEAISWLEFRQEDLFKLNRKFDNIQTEIELLCTDDTTEAVQERHDFETNYF